MMLLDVMLVCLCVCVHADMTRAHVYLNISNNRYHGDKRLVQGGSLSGGLWASGHTLTPLLPATLVQVCPRRHVQNTHNPDDNIIYKTYSYIYT